MFKKIKYYFIFIIVAVVIVGGFILNRRRISGVDEIITDITDSITEARRINSESARTVDEAQGATDDIRTDNLTAREAISAALSILERAKNRNNP